LGDEWGLTSVVFPAKLWADGALFDEASWDVVEEFGDFLSNEFKLIFVGFVPLGKDGLFGDFKLIPAFEAAVVLTLGLFGCGIFFVCPRRFWVVVSRGGLGLFRL